MIAEHFRQHPAGGGVVDIVLCDDPPVAQRARQPQHRAARLGSIAFAPVIAPEPIAQLYLVAIAGEAHAADQLGGRTPEVQTATVKDKSYQRLVVGPPSSQQSARDLCNQLKAAGHTGDCWVKAY